MNRRTLFILLVTFVALVVIAFLQTRPSFAPGAESTLDPSIQPTTNAEDFLSEYKLMGTTLGMSVDDITAIRLRDPESNQSFAISRDTTGKWISTDSQGSLDPTAADNIAKTVGLLPYEKTIEVTASTSLADFGFMPDGIFSIELLLRDGKTHAIVIGDLTASLQSYYGLVDDKTEIYVLERRAIDFLLIQLNKPPLT